MVNGEQVANGWDPMQEHDPCNELTLFRRQKDDDDEMHALAVLKDGHLGKLVKNAQGQLELPGAPDLASGGEASTAGSGLSDAGAHSCQQPLPSKEAAPPDSTASKAKEAPQAPDQSKKG